ncbi:ABC transporter substrate-binding protein [Flammeovirga aprica]|uniref:ABC transporter substrate-binding protein n=1 Tax=Flammeovirga aprica JL-4 TaxID=694437 RepID=A0A7X9RUR5_9BACT|nr:ABC transporter substrate-binding protein [Flammeovirga aprica]NME69081.1 ABC transporter substrate-binding protein [Flammeovirga aprica JL-4]
MSQLSNIIVVFIVFLFALGCNSTSQENTNSSQEKQQTASAVSSTVHYAKTFKLEYKEGYKLLHLIDPFSGYQNTTTFALLPHGAKKPEGFKKNQIIRIPVKKVITTTTAQTSMMEELGSIDCIKGYVAKDYMYSQPILDKMDNGEIIAVGYDIASNTEKIIASTADLVVVSGSSTTNSSSFPILNKVNIPVIANTDWQENHLLGRAEWIKVFGALLDKEKEANTIFEEVERKYKEYIELAKKADSKPSVISGLPYKGMWSVPGGKSYLAIAFDQATADYPWSETTQTGSIQLDLEAVYAKGGHADYWFNVGQLTTLEALKNNDSRYTKFNAFKEGNVYNSNKRLRNGMANDYWATGMVHPELILADLIKILHPDLLPDHQLFFYHKLK